MIIVMTDSNEKEVDIGFFSVSCDTALEIKDALDQVSLDALDELYSDTKFNDPWRKISDSLRDLSETITETCSVDEAGAELTPSPTPSDASKTESLEIDR